jgi:hypothetical protein
MTALALAFALMLFASAGPASAQFTVDLQHGQHKSEPIERVATGKVVDKSGAPLAGAVVYLKNTRTNTVKTYISDNDGQFRFGELSQDTDYEVWAESEGVRSKSRGISSFDSQNKFYFALKVDAPKSIAID